MSAALRMRSRINRTLQLNPYIERIFDGHPAEDALLPPVPPTPVITKDRELDMRHVVVVSNKQAKPSSLKGLPVLPTIRMRQILKFKLQTCFVGVLRQLDMLQQTDPDMVPHHQLELVLQHLLSVALNTTNTGVMAYALMQDPNTTLKTLSPSQQLVADRDLLVDQHVFDYAFWSLYEESRNSEQEGSDPMARSRRMREFMVSARMDLFRLFNVQLLNIVEAPVLQQQTKQLTQLLFNVVWCVCGVDNCRLMRDATVWQETVNKMTRCGRVLDDRPTNLLHVLQNLGAVTAVDDHLLAALHDNVGFLAGVMLDRYFDAAFSSKSPNMLYSSLNDYDQTYVDNARQSMCAAGDTDLGCFMFVRFDKARAVILSWATYYYPERMKDAYLVGTLLNRLELARLAKYIEMRLYSFLYFVGKLRTLLTKQVEFRMGDQVVRVDNSQGSLDPQLVSDMLRYAALATAAMDSAWGVQALEMLPLIAIDFDDDVSEHELEQVHAIQQQHKAPTELPESEAPPGQSEAVTEEQQAPMAEEPELNPEDFSAMFDLGMDEEQEMAQHQPVEQYAATREDLDELFASPPAARQTEKKEEEEMPPREERRPMNSNLFKQSPVKKEEDEEEMSMLPVRRTTSFLTEARGSGEEGEKEK